MDENSSENSCAGKSLDARTCSHVNLIALKRTVINLLIQKIMKKSVQNSEVKVANKSTNRKAKATKKVENPIEVQVVSNEEVIASEDNAERKPLIVMKPSYGRFYVYFKGVKPEDNVGCGCKTAKSAIRYMLMLKQKHNAVIFNKDYEILKAEAAKEA